MTNQCNAARADRTIDAIEVMNNLGTGLWTEQDCLSFIDPTELIAGLREYANFLEALIISKASLDVPTVRAAAVDVASRLRERPDAAA